MGDSTIRRIWQVARRARLEIIVIIALGLAVFAPGLGNRPLVDWDEATYAQVAHELVANGRYLELSWNGAPYLKKPPLLFWTVAGSFKTFGESEFSARLPSALCAMLTMLLLYASGCEGGRRISGLFAATIPLGFYFFVARGGRECATDPFLIMFSTLAMYAALKARTAGRWLVVAGAALGLAILSKGAAGLIALIAIVLAALLVPEFSTIGQSGIAVILAVAALVAGPWFAYEAAYNPLFWKTFVGQETLQRVLTHLEAETQPAYYTLLILVKEVYWLFPIALPLTLIAATSARDGVWRALRSLPPAIALWTLWLLVALAAAFAVQTRLAWYVLPALMPAALLAGAILGYAFSHRGSRLWLSTGALTVAMLLAQVPYRVWSITTTLATEHARSLPSFMLALRARETALVGSAGELYFAGIGLPTLVYYSGLHCNFVRPQELTEAGDPTDDSAPVSMRAHDLVLLPADGDAMLIANYDDEWQNGSTAQWPAAPSRPSGDSAPWASPSDCAWRFAPSLGERPGAHVQGSGACGRQSIAPCQSVVGGRTFAGGGGVNREALRPAVRKVVFLQVRQGVARARQRGTLRRPTGGNRCAIRARANRRQDGSRRFAACERCAKIRWFPTNATK